MWTPIENSAIEYEREYIASLQQHIAYVREAGKKIGVLDYLLDIHDNSKWSPQEFDGYAKHFKGGGAPDEFAKAWLHHIHWNPHHWQHWIFPDNYTPKGSLTVENGVVEMPEPFAVEMIADWMGAGRTYTGSWDMTDWLIENIPRIIVHSHTAAFLKDRLIDLGYKGPVMERDFKIRPIRAHL